MLTFLAGHCFFSFSTSISRCSSSNRKTLLLKNSESCEIIAKILQASLSNHKTEAEKKQVKIGKSIGKTRQIYSPPLSVKWVKFPFRRRCKTIFSLAFFMNDFRRQRANWKLYKKKWKENGKFQQETAQGKKTRVAKRN